MSRTPPRGGKDTSVRNTLGPRGADAAGDAVRNGRSGLDPLLMAVVTAAIAP